MRTARCEHFGEKQVLEIYPAPLGVGVTSTLRSDSVAELDLEGVVMQIKVRCDECGRVWLDEMTFPKEVAES